MKANLCAMALALAPTALSFHVNVGGARQSTSLKAISVLARKAKEAEVAKYLSEEIDEATMACYRALDDVEEGAAVPTHLRDNLTKRKGTLTVLAEYKRQLKDDGFVNEVFEPGLMSPLFREFGAAAVAVMTDKRIGGCTYDDLKHVSEEQEGARGEVPGPLPVICSDLIVDEVQVARAKASGAQAVKLDVGLLTAEKLPAALNAAKALGMEAILQVGSPEEIATALKYEAKMVVVNSLESVETKAKWRADLIPADVTAICCVNAYDNKQLEEVQEAWELRDAGYQGVWVSDCLFKSGNDPTEHAGAIINAMRSKSSVKYASPRSKSGRGEGVSTDFCNGGRTE